MSLVFNLHLRCIPAPAGIWLLYYECIRAPALCVTHVSDMWLTPQLK